MFVAGFALIWQTGDRNRVKCLIFLYFLVFSPLQTFLINPENSKPENQTSYFTDPDVLENIPTTFLYLAAIYALIFFIGFILCTEAPNNANNDAEEESQDQGKISKIDTIYLKLKVNIKTQVSVE